MSLEDFYWNIIDYNNIYEEVKNDIYHLETDHFCSTVFNMHNSEDRMTTQIIEIFQ